MNDERRAARSTDNEDLVLRFIWERGPVSRAELSRSLGLSRSTISTLTDAWIQQGLVVDLGRGTSTGGKPPILVGIKSDAAYFVGVELASTELHAVIVDFSGTVIGTKRHEFDNADHPDRALTLLKETVDELVGRHGVAHNQITGLGLSVPSPFDPKFPDRLSRLVLPKWADIPITATLRETFKVPIFVDNDANLGAMAEYWWGDAPRTDNLAFIKMSTGIGMGYVVHGETFHGATGVAGEIGHISMDPNGLPCICGMRGCLNTIVGQQSIVEEVRRRQAQKPVDGTHFSRLSAIIKAAQSGDTLCQDVLQDAAEVLGTAIGNMANLFNPAKVVLHGELTEAGSIFWDSLRKTTEQKTLWIADANTQVEPTSLGEHAVALGAATLVLKRGLLDTALLLRARP